MQYKKYIYTLTVLIIFGGILFTSYVASSATMAERLNGRILLQVEQNGESWYVYPSTQTKFYLGRPTHAFDIMRYRGLGITDADLSRISVAGSNDSGDGVLQERLSGYILLQVEQNGEAWYVNPSNLQRYYLGRPADAFDIMRELGLGITDNDLGQITTDSSSMDLITEDNTPDNTPEESEDPESEPESVPDETQPILTNFMVNFGTYNSETGMAGDYYFEPYTDKVFGGFGRTVSGPDGPKTLPSFDYFVSSNADIVAPMNAVVTGVIYQESTSDYEIHTQSSTDNVWVVSFDHIQNLSSAIVEGASITAGQYLGHASPWGNSYMVELMIFRSVDGGGSMAYCPYNFFSTSLKATFSTSLNTLMSDWETYKGDSSIYDESAYIKPGCLVESEAG
ncbi:MAG: hypothetical protein ACNFW9_02740 [Candidatus Kerfeldbacteria bacterium]